MPIRFIEFIGTEVSQDDGGPVEPPDTTPPVLQSAVVEHAAPTAIVLTYDEPIDAASVPATTDFAPSGGKTVSSVAILGATVTLTVNSAYVNGNAITVSYTPGLNPIRDVAGNNAASLTASAVVNNILDTTAPVLSSAVVEQAQPTKIVLTYGEALDAGSVPSPADYAPSGKTVSTVAIDGTVVTLTVSSAYSLGQTITLSYTPGAAPLQDASGNFAASLSAHAVTNNVVAIPVAFVQTANLTDEGNEVYAATSSGTATGAQGIIAEASSPGVEAWIEVQKPATGDGSMVIAFDVVRTLQGFSGNDFIAQIATAGLVSYGVNTASLTSSGYTLPEGANNRCRLRRSAANAITVETTTDNGLNWTVRHTFAATPTSVLRSHYYTTFSTTPRKMYQPRHAGLRFDLLGSKFMADGNSQTEGVNGAGNSFPGQLATALAVTVTNFGVGGQDTTDMASDAATQIDAILQTGMNILIVGEIRNQLVEMGGSANARTALDAFWAYCDARRAASTATKQLRIVAWNILPAGHTASPIGIVALNALFDEVNALMAAEWRLHVNAFVDVRSNANLTDPFDTTYFVDDVHLTTAGDAIMAGLMQTAVQALS
jgi:hypothetical protein